MLTRLKHYKECNTHGGMIETCVLTRGIAYWVVPTIHAHTQSVVFPTSLPISGGATSASSVLSAFRYAKFVMGFECMDAILQSKRLKGLSDILFAGKRKLLQAQTLTVQQVRILHSVLENDDSDVFDKAAAGFMLTALYGRCRVSDLIFLDSIKHDHDASGGFVELFTAVHKTGRSAAKKATLLPILCPAVGVTGSNWVTHALQAFDKVGLKFSGNLQGPLLRPPSHEGSYLCNRSVNATEVGRLLRGLFGLDIAMSAVNMWVRILWRPPGFPGQPAMASTNNQTTSTNNIN